MAKYKGRHTRAQKEEDALERSYRSIAPAKRGRKKSKKRQKGAGFAIFVALLAIAVAIFAGYVYLSDANLDGVILHNVTVAGVDVGGMTQRDAIEAVKTATADTYGTKQMVVKVLDSQAELPASCCPSFNVQAAVRAAYKFGNTGSESKRQEEQQIAMTSGYAVDITPYLSLNEQNIRQIISELGKDYNTTLSQTSYEVTGKAPEQALVVTLGVPEYGLNLEELYQQILDAYNQNLFSVEGECGIIEPNPIDLQSILQEHYKEPVNASFDPKTFDVIDGKDGYGFDVKAAEKELAAAAYGSTVTIPFVAIPPEITSKDLTNMLYRDKLATYTASHESDHNRDVNLALACEAINEVILYPGDVFSYNDTLGERTESRGYKPGESYAGNETVTTIGGGICQVSSSLYYCAMVADLEILMRDNHGFATSYMPLGMDATVSWGSIDFRFRNTTDYPIKIEAQSSEGSTTVSIYGTDTNDYYTKLEYEKLKTYEYSKTYQTMPANNPQGYQDGDYITEPYTGYDIKTYRCRYDKETDELISKEYEATSNYRKRDAVVCVIEGAVNQPGSNNAGIGGGGVSEDPGALPPE